MPLFKRTSSSRKRDKELEILLGEKRCKSEDLMAIRKSSQASRQKSLLLDHDDQNQNFLNTNSTSTTNTNTLHDGKRIRSSLSEQEQLIDPGGGDELGKISHNSPRSNVIIHSNSSHPTIDEVPENSSESEQDFGTEQGQGHGQGQVVQNDRVSLDLDGISYGSLVIPESIRHMTSSEIDQNQNVDQNESKTSTDSTTTLVNNNNQVKPSEVSIISINKLTSIPSVLQNTNSHGKNEKMSKLSVRDWMTTQLYRCLMNSVEDSSTSSLEKPEEESSESSVAPTTSTSTSNDSSNSRKNVGCWTGPTFQDRKSSRIFKTATGLMTSRIKVKSRLLEDPQLSFSSLDTCHSRDSLRAKRNAKVQSNWRLWNKKKWEQKKWRKSAIQKVFPERPDVNLSGPSSNFRRREPNDTSPARPSRRQTMRVLRIENKTLDCLLRLALCCSLVMIFCGVALIIVFTSFNIGPTQYVKAHLQQNLVKFLLMILAIFSPFFIGIFSIYTLVTPSKLRTFYLRMPLLIWIQISMIIISTKILNHVDLNLEDDFLALIPSYRTVPIQQEFFDEVHNQFYCCGVHSYKDWIHENASKSAGLNGIIPDSCCKKKIYNCGAFFTSQSIWKKGCYLELMAFYHRTIKAFIGFSSLELVAEISLIILYRLIYNQVKYVIPDNRPILEVIFGQIANICDKNNTTTPITDTTIDGRSRRESTNQNQNRNVNNTVQV